MSRFILPHAKRPEDVGVSSSAIAKFMDEIEASGLNVHSFIVIRHGKIAAECYRAPYTKEMPHALYSVSKTVTATAVGFAVDEGLISLDDKVKDFFPGYTKDINDARLDCLTVRHLITMTSGKAPSLLDNKSKGNWIEKFFAYPWYADPGKEYRYISENIYMLAAIIYFVTGMNVSEYLKPRLFEPLGIDLPEWEKDSLGIEAGGWGCYLKTEDMAKIMLCYLNKGAIGKNQIIPRDFAVEAVKKQADNSMNVTVDTIYGYGYCIWRNAVEGYRADGMFSQFGIVFDEHDAVLAFNSGIADEQKARDFIFRHFPAAFTDECDAGETDPALQKRLGFAVQETPFDESHSATENYINGKSIVFRKKIFLNLIGFPVSMLPLTAQFMLRDRGGNIDNMTFLFDSEKCLLSWREGDDFNSIPVGMDGRFKYGKMALGGVDYNVCSTGTWLEADKLKISVRPINCIGKRTLDFTFSPCGRVLMKPSSTPGIHEIALSLLRNGFEIFNKPRVEKIASGILNIAPHILEPVHKGHFR